MRNGQLADYLLALLIFAGAVAARALLDWVVPDRLPFITFFPAVLLAAYYFGRGPGLMVLVLSAIAGTAWVDATGPAFTLYAVSSILFICVASIIVVFVFDICARAQDCSRGL